MEAKLVSGFLIPTIAGFIESLENLQKEGRNLKDVDKKAFLVNEEEKT